MKTAKEFMQDLKDDETLMTAFRNHVKDRQETGETDYKAIIISFADEKGYAVTEEELDDLYEANAAELSEEELGKVAGGTNMTAITEIYVTANPVSMLSFSVSDGPIE